MKRLPDPTFDQRVADWLEEDPTLAPREVLATVLAAYPSIEQRPALGRPWRTPSMTRFALPAAAALVVVVSGALLLPQLITPPAGNQSPSPPPGIASPPATQAPTTPPRTSSPTQPTPVVVFQAVRSTGGHHLSTVWVESVDGSISRELTPGILALRGRTADGGRALVFSYDFEQLLAFVDVYSGERQPIPSDCPTDACWADPGSEWGGGAESMTLADDDVHGVMVLSPDDRHGVIAIVDLASGATTAVEATRETFERPAAGAGLHHPTLSPDGRSIAYVVSDNDPFTCGGDGAGALMVLDLLGESTPRQLVPNKACATQPRWSPTGDELLYWTDAATYTPTGNPGETTVETYHDVYVVSMAGDIERLTTDRNSAYSAWTRDGRISYAVGLDPHSTGGVPRVWIYDPVSGERSRVAGTIAALGDAGCLACPFRSDGAPSPSEYNIGLWPRA